MTDLDLPELRRLLAEAAPNWVATERSEIEAHPRGEFDELPAFNFYVGSLAPLIVALRNHADALLAAYDECERAKTLAVAAFVQGAAWARFQITEATAFQSELDEAEVAAMKRYPFVPPYYRVELDDARKRAEQAERERDALRAKLGALQAMVDPARVGGEETPIDILAIIRAIRAAKEPTP